MRVSMNEHTCKESKSCCCSIQAMEPDESCPAHGIGELPRCDTCGKFVKRDKVENEYGDISGLVEGGIRVIGSVTEAISEIIS